MKKLTALILLPLAGCGTVVDLSGVSYCCSGKIGSGQLRVYGGARLLAERFEQCGPLSVLDMPLSVALDTALLPATIIAEIDRSSKKE